MRSAASLKASDKGLNLGEISKAAGWSNTETLAVFYKKTISENLGRVILRKYYNLLDCFYCQVLLCFQKGFENGDQSHINTFQGRRTFQRENNFNKTSPRYVNLQIFFRNNVSSLNTTYMSPSDCNGNFKDFKENLFSFLRFNFGSLNKTC